VAGPIRILIVAAEAPPSFNAEAFQVGKIVKALAEHEDLIVDLVTARTKTTYLRLNHLPAISGQHIEISCKLNRLQRGFVKLLLPWMADRPDWWFLFASRWKSIATRLVAKPDVIYSRSFPLSSSIAAYRLASFFGVPWFLHLSDPWTESSLNPEWKNSNWHSLWEFRCFNTASRISFTSDITLKRYQSRYPSLSHKMLIDPNVYDEGIINNEEWAPKRKFTIVHSGKFTRDHGRNPSILLRAINSLPSDHPLFRDLQVIHAGESDRRSSKLLQNAGSWLTIVGCLPPSQISFLQRRADLLLAIDWHFENPLDSQHVLSKLTDYLPIRRPVVLVTDDLSASHHFLNNSKFGVTVNHNDYIGLQEVILNYWYSWRKRDSSKFNLPAPCPLYNSHALANKLQHAVSQVLHTIVVS
jgi:hypothetical protein